MPPGVDLDANVAEARQHRHNLYWFYQKVRNNREHRPDSWDYKQLDPTYEDAGNFNYGLTGMALGLSEALLLSGAGLAQRASGTSRPEWGRPGLLGYGGEEPYGDDPRDQVMIKAGIEYYLERYQSH